MYDPIAVNKLNKLLTNLLSIRRGDLSTRGGKHDINGECGFEDRPWTPDEYYKMYDEEAIAKRVVEAMPKESWQGLWKITDDKKADNRDSAFCKSFDAISNMLRPGSTYCDETNDILTDYWLRWDILSGISSYGVLFMGIDDGLDLREPAAGVEEEGSAPGDKDGKPVQQPYKLTSNAKGRKLTQLRVFPEVSARITQWEMNKASPRFGQPLQYTLYFNDPRAAPASGAWGSGYTTETVHWTRCLHLPCDPEGHEYIGNSRMRHVRNNLFNIRKLHAGPESAWKNGLGVLSAETHPQLGGEVDLNEGELRDAMQHVWESLQKALVTRGVTINSLAPPVFDPTTQLDCQLKIISIALEMPMRILMGTERGNLASLQDSDEWDVRKDARRRKVNIPRIIVPFCDRGQLIGFIEKPKAGKYYVECDDVSTMPEDKRCAALLSRTTAWSTAVTSGLFDVVPIKEYATKFDNFTDDEAKAMEDAQGDLPPPSAAVPPKQQPVGASPNGRPAPAGSY